MEDLFSTVIGTAVYAAIGFIALFCMTWLSCKIYGKWKTECNSPLIFLFAVVWPIGVPLAAVLALAEKLNEWTISMADRHEQEKLKRQAEEDMRRLSAKSRKARRNEKRKQR